MIFLVNSNDLFIFLCFTGKVESQLKTHPLVENICVYADSFQSHTVAIMVPIKNALMKMAQDLGKSSLDYESLCKDNEVIQV